MPIHLPDIKEVIEYIILTNRADHIEITNDDVQKAMKKIHPINPYVEGHFKAFNFAQQLADSPDFPAKDMSLLTNQHTSHTCLYWLRELHILMMYPIAQFGKNNSTQTGQYFIKNHEVGTYRVTPKMLAFAPAPPPETIPQLLHLWLRDITELDHEIKDKVDNPYGLTQSQGNRLFDKLDESCLFLSCLQPFEDGNNRIAKLVENVLRLRWRMPWRTIYGVENDTFIRKLTAYQEEPDGFARWIKQL
jgi:hypothetical protein